MTINIICIGKLHQSFQAAFKRYYDRLKFFGTINIIELKEHNHSNQAIQIKQETKAILAVIPPQSHVFLCAPSGKQMDSLKFSKQFEKANITFVIGGSHGVDESQFSHIISFSQMTYPHQLFRVILIEQIYRAFTIKKFIKYHK